MSLLDFSPQIPLGTFSILLGVIKWADEYTSSSPRRHFVRPHFYIESHRELCGKYVGLLALKYFKAYGWMFNTEK